MFLNPPHVNEYLDALWNKFEPFFQALLEQPLTQESLPGWLSGWTWVSDLLNEVYSRLNVANTADTADEKAEQRYHSFLEQVLTPAMAAEQKLKMRLLESGLEPEGFEVPLRNMRSEAALFREANLPLITQERKLDSEYQKIIGAQTIVWEGQETTILQLENLYQQSDRATRKQIWLTAARRRLEDRPAINGLWRQFMDLRGQMASNADYPDYRAYRWEFLQRFDYTPEDCETFHQAIEKVVVPAASRIYEKRRLRLGVDPLRPWDLDLAQGVYPFNLPPLHPFDNGTELESKVEKIFQHLDSTLGQYYATMRAERLLDLENRKRKAPGAYCTSFPVAKRPFIFMNAVGIHDDVQTLLHESGHAFHVFETNHLPYHQQREVGSEFAEVASMSMELLAAPYLSAGAGGFYSEPDAARARIEHLERNILFWPYMAVVDAFQHWVYTHHESASEPEHCDARWAELWERFIPAVSWDGLDEERMTGWHRKLHIHGYPFYYVEYGLAQLGAVQVWATALKDQATAVNAYRKALSLGGTVPLPQLFSAAGARFAFDADTLQMAVDLMESTIAELESQKA